MWHAATAVVSPCWQGVICARKQEMRPCLLSSGCNLATPIICTVHSLARRHPPHMIGDRMRHTQPPRAHRVDTQTTGTEAAGCETGCYATRWHFNYVTAPTGRCARARARPAGPRITMLFALAHRRHPPPAAHTTITIYSPMYVPCACTSIRRGCEVRSEGVWVD